MKKLFLFMVCLVCGTITQAQIANTKWAGKLAVPELLPVTLSFKADVFEIYLTENMELLESMSYKISGDTLNLTKTTGGSPCADGSSFKLKHAMKDGQLVLTLISDDCAERASAWTQEPFTKVKE